VGVRASGSMAVEGPSLRRRVGAVVVAVMVAASLVPLLAGPAQAAGRFTDDDGSVHEPNIEFIAARGITQGCSTTNPDLFCPNDPVTRGQMASFLARALGLPPATTDFFPDDSGSVHEDNINRIAQAGITGGFADGTYRPNDLVTRGQMASFIARGFDLPPATTDFFPDDNGTTHEDNINRIAQAGITTGFPDGTYRPNDTVTRGQMASFLRRAIDYTTTGTTSTTSTTSTSTTSTTVPGGSCSTVPPVTEGSLPIVGLPFSLGFSGEAGGVCDKDGVGTGFPYVWPKPSGSGYVQGNLDVVGGELRVVTTSGLAAGSSDSQDNGLGVGLEPGQSFVASTRLVNPPGGTGFEQGGLWFGTQRFGQADYVKLVVLYRSSGGPAVQLLVEEGNVTSGSRTVTIGDPSSSVVELELSADAGAQTVSGRFRVDGGSWQSVGAALSVPTRLFTQDQAGVDANLGTDSFVGVFASHRNGPGPVTYRFDSFGVAELSAPPPPPPPPGEVAFTAATTTISYKPTSMRVGPDGRLYVLDALGAIRAYQVNSNGSTTLQNTYTPLPPPSEGIYTALGLEIDPSSTAQNVTVWVSHSITIGDNFSEGLANSSTVTRIQNLTGGSPTVTNMITGLPRAYANHAINSLRFGPDGWLYIAMGGQTGAGGPNTQPTEFSTRPEQYYSAALIRADVKRSSGWNPSSHGSCATTVNDTTGVAQSTPNPNCDVQFVATGLRNMYDFVFATDGFIYGPDNALGVAGTVPLDYQPNCQGIVGDDKYPAYDPGTQPDRLHRFTVGGNANPNNVTYRGHPNPSRSECVFYDGAFQTALFGTTVTPPARYQTGLVQLNTVGTNQARSYNGTIQYQASTFGGALTGQLVMTTFAGALSNQGIYRIDPANPATPQRITVTSGGSTYSWNQPLPLIELADGRIAVGEFRGRTTSSARIVILTPDTSSGGTGGSWETKAALPQATVDAGSDTLAGLLYVVGGKTSATNRLDTVRTYNPATNTWTTLTSDPVPGGPREDIAVAAHDGKLYTFGGASSNAFTADSTTSAVYDPAAPTGSRWTTLAPMPTPRTGAAAISWNGLIWIIGGLDASGNSTNTTLTYNPTTNTWSTGLALPEPRDNAGATILSGHLYLFGGRNRQSGTGPTLATTWRLQTPGGSWDTRAPIPAARRAFIVGNTTSAAQLFGGESGSDPAIATVHEYNPTTNTWTTLTPMPTGRHGPAGATITGITYIAGGATTSGANNPTTTHQAFTR
jgi:large repetitive protein